MLNVAETDFRHSNRISINTFKLVVKQTNTRTSSLNTLSASQSHLRLLNPVNLDCLTAAADTSLVWQETTRCLLLTAVWSDWEQTQGFIVKSVLTDTVQDWFYTCCIRFWSLTCFYLQGRTKSLWVKHVWASYHFSALCSFGPSSQGLADVR